ncbi:glucose PTS transporter subunit EIIB, partial [Vagococcus salmoninarum]
MADFKKDAVTLLKHLGSSENISSVSHCATRLRFVLVDPTKADQKAVENIPSVQGLFTQAGQFQVIIGNQVATFYQEFIQLPGVYSATKEETKLAAKQNQSVLQRIIGTFAEIFAPIIPALVVGGLILGFRNVLGEIPFAAFDDQPIVAVSQFWDGVNHFLWIIGEAIFHFLPVGITWSIARKMGGT